VHRRDSGTTRVPILAYLAFAAAACLVLSGCSPGADYPSPLFPAVHDMPPPRSDTTLDPAQVQQATEDLISARNHLSTEAQGSGAAKAPANQTAAKTGDKPAERKKPANAQTAAPAAPAATPATGGTQTAGAEPKP
jgi:hypothetical protein